MQKKFSIAKRNTTKDTTSLKNYFSEIKKYKLLSPDEEYELAMLAHQGDDKAVQDLINHNLRFVVSVAKQYETATLKLEDLINEGNIGLIVAAQKFDPSRGFKFISYAIWWIRRNVIAYISDHAKTIRLPNNKTTINFKIKTRAQVLEQKLQHKPTLNDMLNEFGDEFTEDDLEFYLNTNNRTVSSLDMAVGGGEESDGTALINLIENQESLDASFFVNQSDDAHRNEMLLNLLKKETEREVINLLFGLDGKEPMSLKTTGFVLGLSSERVRQIRDNALKRLKIILEDN